MSVLEKKIDKQTITTHNTSCNDWLFGSHFFNIRKTDIITKISAGIHTVINKNVVISPTSR
jgi:polyisoprenoid-binding protein YceI